MNQRIQDMPDDERPREKLIKLGPTALDHAELLALFLSSGFKGTSAIELGREMIRHFGSLAALGAASVEDLERVKGLGKAKATRLAAVFELGARVARERLQRVPLDTPEAIYEAFAPQMGHLVQEQVVVALLNSRLQHDGTEIISKGTVNESSAHPREVMRPVIRRNAYGFVMIHNHPSGDPTPSRADEQVTRRMVEASSLMQVKFLDHVIIGRPGAGRAAYFSFREAGLVP